MVLGDAGLSDIAGMQLYLDLDGVLLRDASRLVAVFCVPALGRGFSISHLVGLS